MSFEPSDSVLLELPADWRSLWRAQSSASAAGNELTIFVRAGGRDAAHLAIKRAVQAMFPAAYQDLDEAYYNLSSALDLLREGLSERYIDRLFETAWSGEKVEAWVSSPVFVVPQAAALYAAWINAQLGPKAPAEAVGALLPPDSVDASSISVQRDPSYRKAAIVHLDREPSEADLQHIEAVLNRALRASKKE